MDDIPDYIANFYKAVYPESTEIAMNNKDEKECLEDATTLIKDLRNNVEATRVKALIGIKDYLKQSGAIDEAIDFLKRRRRHKKHRKQHMKPGHDNVSCVECYLIIKLESIFDIIDKSIRTNQ